VSTVFPPRRLHHVVAAVAVTAWVAASCGGLVAASGTGGSDSGTGGASGTGASAGSSGSTESGSGGASGVGGAGGSSGASGTAGTGGSSGTGAMDDGEAGRVPVDGGARSDSALDGAVGDGPRPVDCATISTSFDATAYGFYSYPPYTLESGSPSCSPITGTAAVGGMGACIVTVSQTCGSTTYVAQCGGGGGFGGSCSCEVLPGCSTTPEASPYEYSCVAEGAWSFCLEHGPGFAH
jgi:hypothetical protein